MTNDTSTGSADFTPPVALIAGASRGLGLLIARELAQRGHRVVICSRTREEVERAAAMLIDEGHEAKAAVCDVRDVAAVEALVEQTELEWGPIEVMICVAGIIQAGPLAALQRAHFDEAVATMLWGPVNTGLVVAARMRRRGRGRIGVVTSVGGVIPAPHLLPYSTAKFGAVGFTRGLRTELAGSGVTATTIIPGLMRTGSHVRARFAGKQTQEYAWFAAAASLPLISMDADRAARRMVEAVLAGRSVLTLTPLTKIAMKGDALFPRTASALLELSVRLLPKAPGQADDGRSDAEGREVGPKMSTPGRFVFRRLTVLGRRAAEANNELPDDLAGESA